MKKIVKNSNGDIFAIVVTKSLINDFGSFFGYYDEVIIQKDRGLCNHENNFLWDYFMENTPVFSDVWNQYYWGFKEVDYDEFHDLLKSIPVPA